MASGASNGRRTGPASRGKMLTVKEAAEQLGLTPHVVRLLMHRGELPATDLGAGRQVRLYTSQQDVDTFLAQRKLRSF